MAACPTGKRRYGIEQEADNALRRFWRTATQKHMPIRHYECPLCKGWHLTSKQKRTP